MDGDTAMIPASPLRRAVKRMLAPLVRILLKEGISYGTFADIAREVFVTVAMEEFAIKNRKQSISRVSVLTGLTRKAVKAILDQPAGAAEEAAERYNRATRVVAGWRKDKAFLDEKGRPAVLPFSGDGGDFSSLVKKYSGDMPARAVLDELERTHTLRKLDDGRVQLLARAFLPTGDTEMKLHILGTDVSRLIATIGHNLDAEKNDLRFQRNVFYDNLPREALEALRRLSAEQSQALLEKLDRALSLHDRDNHPEIDGTGRYAAGVGIYFFEENKDHES